MRRPWIDALLGCFFALVQLLRPFPRPMPSLPPAPSGELAMAQRLERDVRMLAENIGPRSPEQMKKLEAAAAYVEKELQAAGWVVENRPFIAEGRRLRNLVAKRPGKGPAL